MKKLLFVLAFTFIGQQAFSQMYIIIVSDMDNVNLHPSPCSNSAYDAVITTIDPQGNITYDCMPSGGQICFGGSSIALLNQKFNSLTSQGYKLVSTENNSILGNDIYGVWYFAIPWTSSGLEEVATTLKSFIISPNPANTFVDISLDYPLKGESEVVFISDAGYISHKQSISNISKNEKYNIDISKIPAGKYLVTIVNGKTYTTPQKLIVL